MLMTGIFIGERMGLNPYTERTRNENNNWQQAADGIITENY